MEEIKTDITLKGVFKKVGIGALAVLTLFEGGMIAIDEINSHKGNEMMLLSGGCHMKEGERLYVITQSFYDNIKNETELDKELVMNSFKQVYTTLNHLSSKKLQFKLCTTSKEASKEFNLPYVTSYTRYDVPLYVYDGDIDGNSRTLGTTDYKKELVTCYLKDLSITFKKEMLFAVYKMYEDPAQLIDPANSVAYTICAHESMHSLGFAHRGKDSILYPYLPSPYHDFTELDKQLLVKYNQTYYNATPEYVLNQNNNYQQSQPENSYTYTPENYIDEFSK